MKFIHFLYENDYKALLMQNLSLLQNERSFFSGLFRQHRDEIRFVNPALISGCHHNKKKRKMHSSAFYHNYLFLCKKSGIFRDLVATLERKSAGGFWMPLNA